MKKLLFIFIFFSCALSFAQEKKVCRLGEDPADPARRVDWTRECIVRPAAEQLVKMSTGSGKPVDCFLPRFTPIVVEKSSGIARWVLGCGNQILQPTSWVPQGTRECAPEPAPSQEIKLSPSTVKVEVEGEITHRVEVGGELRHVHSGEVILKQEERSHVSETPPAPQKSWWQKNRKWVIPLAILGGGVVAGYAAASRSGSAPKGQISYQPLPPPIKR